MKTTVVVRPDLLGLPSMTYVEWRRPLTSARRLLVASRGPFVSGQTAIYRPTFSRRRFADTRPVASPLVSPRNSNDVVMALTARPRLISVVARRGLHRSALAVPRLSTVGRPRQAVGLLGDRCKRREDRRSGSGILVTSIPKDVPTRTGLPNAHVAAEAEDSMASPELGACNPPRPDISVAEVRPPSRLIA